MAQDINWFPGHMRKALNDTSDKLKLVDLVYETVDARIPFSSRNPELDKIIGSKKRIVILNKSDLADPNVTNEWIKHLESKGVNTIAMKAIDRNNLKNLNDITMQLMKDILDKAESKGRTGRPIRVMVVGVPNTGKSTLINSLAGKKSAVTGDKPGVTRAPKWIPTGGRLELMDMPGVLWPKLGTRKNQVVLAATGAVKAEVTDIVDVAYDAANLLWDMYPELMSDRYKVNEGINDPYDRFLAMAKGKGCLMSGGRIDEDRFSRLLLDDLRQGRIGRITFERP
ncbi:MAG: ribosome biogenesis GTPase YlqF [Saccharofermentans sp.]|nr:ribosome biogenesis GTPase YlqF [Saccharofermentans sp.]